MALKQAQELHGLTTEPAADLNPDDDKTAAPRASSSGYVRSRLRRGSTRRYPAGLRAGVELAAPCERAHNGGV